MTTLLMLSGRQWNWYMQFICRRNTDKCSRLCAPEVTQINLPGISIFIFKLYFTSSQTIIHYSQEDLHLRSYYAFTNDRTEDMAFTLSFLYFVYKYKVVITKSRQPSFSLQKECTAYLWKLLMNFYTPFLFLLKETDSRIGTTPHFLCQVVHAIRWLSYQTPCKWQLAPIGSFRKEIVHGKVILLFVVGYSAGYKTCTRSSKVQLRQLVT